MKLLKILFLIGCVAMVAGDVLLVLNSTMSLGLPALLVFGLLGVGIAGIVCGIVYFMPRKTDK